MAMNNSQNSNPKLPLSIISKLAGARSPLLAGESAIEYQEGLQATIDELEASTPLQIYLAEKIFDCMWWLRRLETQKDDALVNRMWEFLKAKIQNPPNRQLLVDRQWNDATLAKSLAITGHTPQSLQIYAMKHEADFIATLDTRINDRIKAMRGLQSAYEALANRKLLIERLQLQNQALKQDLAAITVKPIKDDQ